MAERRMFAKTIVLSDAFLDMPLTARCLYFTLGMLADDDGFVNSPKSIIRQCGASEDDLRILIAKKFVIAFENGVIVIKHWRLNNYLRSDRYKPTVYADEKQRITVDESGIYHTDTDKVGIPDIGIPSIGKDRLGKDSIGKGSKGGAGETRTNTRKNNVDLFTELEQGQLSEVYPSMVRWMTYKDEQKKKYTPTGIKSLITQVRKHVDQYGADAVAECIEVSMSNGYQGIIWDRMKKQSAPQNDDNPFLRMLKESENEQTGNAEDTCSTESGIPEFLPGSSKWW